MVLSAGVSYVRMCTPPACFSTSDDMRAVLNDRRLHLHHTFDAIPRAVRGIARHTLDHVRLLANRASTWLQLNRARSRRSVRERAAAPALLAQCVNH